MVSFLGGQTSAALELLLGKMSAHPNGLPVLQSHMNDYNGLYSLYFEKAHIAATSLDIDDIRHLVPGIPLILLSYINTLSASMYRPEILKRFLLWRT